MDLFMIDVLTTMIAERTVRRDKLRAQLDALEAEIRALQEATTRMSGGASNDRHHRAPSSRPGETRERALKREWVSVLEFIGSRQSGASLDDIIAWSELASLNINRNTLRSQTSIYVDRGWLDRISQGVFRLTEAGRQKCGSEPSAENDEADVAGTHVGPSSEGDNLFRDPAHPAQEKGVSHVADR
jgi:hypothetical protein